MDILVSHGFNPAVARMDNAITGTPASNNSEHRSSTDRVVPVAPSTGIAGSRHPRAGRPLHKKDEPLEKALPFETESLCPVCLKRIKATRVLQGDEVFLVKECGDHGSFRTVIWRGEPSMAEWRRPKDPVHPDLCYGTIEAGCPFDCGLCDAHEQLPCSVLIEVTDRCNLHCAVCFADSGRGEAEDPSFKKSRGCWNGPWPRQVRATSSCQEVNPPCGMTFRRSSNLRDGSVIPSSRSIRTVSALPQTLATEDGSGPQVSHRSSSSSTGLMMRSTAL